MVLLYHPMTRSGGAGYTVAMRLVLDSAEDAAHEGWLREMPGAYEWWYFDALSDDGEWAIGCIWFLGNPFSPYYRLAALGQPADPFAHNALFFALYHRGRLHAYHFTRFPRSEVKTASSLPMTLQFGPNRLFLSADGIARLEIADENANGHRLTASLSFIAPPLIGTEDKSENVPTTDHSWLPAAPICRVSGQIVLRAAQNKDAQIIKFAGRGYHDHNWGRLPFDANVQDWYWARGTLTDERAVLLYHVRYRGRQKPVSHLLLFDHGILTSHNAEVRLSRITLNGFGTRYATQLSVESGNLRVQFRLGARLDSAPFYVRALCDAEVTVGGVTETGQGMGEYFRPGIMAWPLVASAMKARIVEA